ncbi:GIY-YIG nuclease family protein [Aquibacillus albus]|uniref:Endonuclease n=1 Tax=Aquibacillus albus TaxID=1168171 RepID=A0ABS2N4T3_9BACI|nr:GIY-YIG nuclease family protein [Aquibacillus albus]MBM7573133.1 putative endonuclease [Aquibacillus albus]
MEEQPKYYVYILKCKDGTFYTGYTNNLNRRMVMHDSGKGAKYTRGRGPFQLVYYQTFPTKEEAMQAEYQIKQLGRKQKEQLVQTYQEGIKSS